MQPYEDINLICVFCGKSFVWIAEEQDFMYRLLADGKISIVLEPKRCMECRRKKKEQQLRQSD